MAADQPEAAIEAIEQIQFVTFTIESEEYGIPTSAVKEIVHAPTVTPVPKSPSCIEGVANLRGSILPIVNLRCQFGVPQEAHTDDTRVVVIEVNGRLAGLLVDRVSEVLRVPGSCIERAPLLANGGSSAFVRGVAKLDNGERLVLLLDLEAVVSIEEAPLTPSTLPHSSVQKAITQHGSAEIGGEQVVTFKLGAEEYAVPITDVKEIIRVPEISRVPNTPSYVEGVVSLRSRLLPIVSLRSCFDMEKVDVDDDSRIVVVSLGSAIIGMHVDAVSGVLRLPPDAVEATPAIVGGAQSGRLRGVAKLDGGRRFILLLDVRQFFPPAEVEAIIGHGSEENAMSDSGDGRLSHTGDEQQFVTFRIETEEFGIGIQRVQEIIWLPRITRVPRTPSYVEGIVNLRGTVLPVIDIRKRFGLPTITATEATSIIVVDVDGRKTGIIVDEVSEVRRLGADAIDPPPALLGSLDASFVSGVGRFDDERRMLIILDIDAVVVLGHDGVAA